MPASGNSQMTITHRLEVDPPAVQPSDLLNREWLLTNGTGSFAMGTAAGGQTRRYHGLLIAATRPPVGRFITLNQVYDRLVFDHLPTTSSDTPSLAGKTLDLCTCPYRDEMNTDVFSPQGMRHLKQFERGLYVTWQYAWGGVQVERSLFLHDEEPAVTLRYRLSGEGEWSGKLLVSPLLTMRDYHSLVSQNEVSYEVAAKLKQLVVKGAGQAVAMRSSDGQFVEQPDWWYRVFYAVEAERGSSNREDVYCPGWFEFSVSNQTDEDILITAALGDQPVDPNTSTASREKRLTQALAAISSEVDDSLELDDPVRGQLAIAADDFVVERTIKKKKLATILAGYPWFADWGRDTFIALPGLLLETGRFEEARATLQAFAETIRRGLVPNRFDDYDDAAAHYNTVDGSMWFIQAALAYVARSGDEESWQDWLGKACCDIIDSYIEGTDFNIQLAGDGLIAAGGPDTQLTWMDAKTGGVVFTPRHGKVIEINAMWFDALCRVGEKIKKSDASKADHYDRTAKRCKRAFAKVFWDDEKGYLVDHIWIAEDGTEHPDWTCRPNQIIACALPNSPLPLTKQRSVLKVVKQKLLTPYGLRTLPTDDPGYHGKYLGDQFQRDSAYHQGTVWPWLIGPYASAVLRCGKFSAKAKQEAFDAISPLLDYMAGDGLGQLHEIHEADVPHRPVGCPAQAWSVAEVLRVLRLIERGDS